MADMGEWSLGLVKKQCLFGRVGGVLILFLSDWLTDVAFLHLSIVNDQSFNMLDGYRMQTSSPGHTLDTTQRSVHAPVFTSRVHPRLRFSVKPLCTCT